MEFMEIVLYIILLMNNICIIEWAENIEDALPETVKTVRIEKLGDDERKIIL